MSGLGQDLRDAFRQLRKRPVGTLAVVLVLALGIGGNTAMFSGFEAWVLRPLDFPEPERLVVIAETRGDQRGLSTSGANLADWTAGQHTLESLGAFQRARFVLDAPEEPVRVEGARVSASLLPLLGKSPRLGRGFSTEDDAPGQPRAVALVSDRLWRTRLGGDPAVLGRSLRLDGRLHEIVGVMEPGFRFPEWAEVWTPLGLATDPESRSDRRATALARLRPGVSAAVAQEELSAIAARLAAAHPEADRGYGVEVRSLRAYFVPDAVRVALSASLAAAFLVLLVICANVASLMLARATARRRETAIRTALGASRSRLLRQSALEGLLLGVAGGAAGAWLGALGLRSMLAYIPVEPPYLFSMSFDASAGIYTLAVSLLAGLACGVAPLARGTRAGLTDALKSGGATAGEGTRGRRARQLLVAGELALSTAVLVAALLMVKSLLALQGVERGYRTAGVVTAELAFPPAGDSEGSGSDRAQRLLAALERVPRLQDVGLADGLPARRSYSTRDLVARDRGRELGDEVAATLLSVAGAYRQALGIPLIRGRDFTAAEVRDGAGVAIVSERLAAQLWGGDDALGRQLGSRDAGPESWLTVVGVVGDVDYGRDMVASSLPEAQLYLPYGSRPVASVAVVARSGRPLADLAPAMRAALREGAPGVPASEVLGAEEAIFRVRWVSAFFSRQLAIYGLIAALIAAVGLYGLTADGVAQRGRELAIRAALGARRRRLLRMIVGEALRLGLAGVGAGLLLGLALARSSAAMLPRVSPSDPAVFGGVALLLLLVSVAASALPAWPASGSDPALTLRRE